MKHLAQIEKETILKAILELGSIKQAAQALAVPPTTIYRKLKRYGLCKGRRIMVNHLVSQLKRMEIVE